MRKELGFFFSAVTSLALTACATGPAQPTIKSEPQSSSANTISTLAPSSTEQFPGLGTDHLLTTTPDARATAYTGTQQAFDSKDKAVLDAEGFSDIIKPSQGILKIKYTAIVSIGNVEKIGGTNPDMDFTYVSLDDTPYAGFVLAISAGHGLSSDYNKQKLQGQYQENYAPQKVTVESINLTGLTLAGDGREVELKRNQFGLDGNYQTDGNLIIDDHALIMIPKDSLPPDVLNKIMQNAIPSKLLSFEPFSANDKVYAVCTPGDTNQTTVLAEGGRFIANYGNAAITGPSISREGCSGSGFFIVNLLTLLRFKGILVADDPYDRNFNLESFVFPLSAIGEEEFWNGVARAANDLSLAK